MNERRPLRSEPRRRPLRRLLLAAAVLVPLAAPPEAVGAQSVLERTPNLGGTWVGSPGTVYFTFLHRFTAGDAPARKVANSPTFLLAAALPGETMVGARYATNSLVVAGFPNEWEFFGRAAPLREQAGAPLDLTLHGGYNEASRSWDGQITLARDVGPLRLLAAGRGFSNFRRQDSRFALAGGATLHLSRFIALAGDVASLVDRAAGEKVAWGAGLQLAIPYTPHTLSLQVSNATTTTLEGASFGIPNGRRYGFEFTVPFTLSRYFGGRSASGGEVAQAPAAGPEGDAAAEVTMSNKLRFSPGTVHIKVGQTVRWRNQSDVVHTVTFDPSLAAKKGDVRLPDGAETFNSGDIKPGAVFTHTFDVPGEYHYICVPHELAGMLAVVIVEK